MQAQAVTLTVAQAFEVALDLWEVAQDGMDNFICMFTSTRTVLKSTIVYS